MAQGPALGVLDLHLLLRDLRILTGVQAEEGIAAFVSCDPGIERLGTLGCRDGQLIGLGDERLRRCDTGWGSENTLDLSRSWLTLPWLSANFLSHAFRDATLSGNRRGTTTVKNG